MSSGLKVTQSGGYVDENENDICDTFSRHGNVCACLYADIKISAKFQAVSYKSFSSSDNQPNVGTPIFISACAN